LLLKKGGFQLRKWTSNSPEVLKNLNPQNEENTSFLFNLDPEASALGLRWFTTDDLFVLFLSHP